MRNYRLLLTFITLFLTTCYLQAQRPGGGRGAGARSNITIKGLVFDPDAGAPLEFATVTLFSKKDSSIVTGGITDTQGKFEIQAPSGGRSSPGRRLRQPPTSTPDVRMYAFATRWGVDLRFLSYGPGVHHLSTHLCIDLCLPACLPACG